MKNNQRLFLDLHAIQSLPPANINRDDTGSPKTAQYGGARRARVSSQAWKKAMREYFYGHSEQRNVGVRTLEIVRYIAEHIRIQDTSITENDSKIKAKGLLEKIKKKKKIFNINKDYKLDAMFFISKYQAQKLAEAAINEEFDIKFLKNILKNTPSIDIALFGRMLAADPSLGEDASAQVAHAISTHAIQNEFDYYTAVDDLAPEDNAGAGMLGTIEFNSSTLYRYANIAVHELLKQLEKPDVVINTVKLFIEAFSNSLPTGKINTFAHQTLPQVLLITLRNDRPVNLVSAFEQPVKSTIGYIEKSIERLSQEFKRVEKFVNKPVLTMYVSFDRVAELQKIGEEKDSLHALLHDFALMLNQLIQPQEGD